MDKAFVLELQQELLAHGYDDVELRYLSDSGENIALNLTYNGVVRRIGLFISGAAGMFYDGDSAGLPLEITTAKQLALQIFDRDSGATTLPDFRKFTGLHLK